MLQKVLSAPPPNFSCRKRSTLPLSRSLNTVGWSRACRYTLWHKAPANRGGCQPKSRYGPGSRYPSFCTPISLKFSRGYPGLLSLFPLSALSFCQMRTFYSQVSSSLTRILRVDCTCDTPSDHRYLLNGSVRRRQQIADMHSPGLRVSPLAKERKFLSWPKGFDFDGSGVNFFSGGAPCSPGESTE